MDSGSEEEFYDAAEDFSCNRSSNNISLPNKQTSPSECQAAIKIEDIEDDKAEPKTLMLDDQESLWSECDKMIIKDSEILRLQTEHNGSSQHDTCVSEINKDIANDNISMDSTRFSGDKVNELTQLNSNKESQSIELKNQQEDVKNMKVPQKEDNTENSPAPVAPPRRKRKQKKEEKQRENNINTAQKAIQADVETSETQENTPCIKVSTSTNEMSQVLKSGNSLDVVFNNDLLINKSGGLPQSTPGSPATSKTTLLRCNSISGRPLTDAEILEQVNIKNLDTGESIPLSLADEKIAQCTNPLALHILRLATENESEVALGHEEEDGHLSDTSSIASAKIQDKRKKLKKFFGKTVQKIRSVADEVTGQGRRMEESESEDEEQLTDDGESIKFKNHRAIKDRLLFRKIKLLQDLSGEHIGAVWTMRFSLCGKLLATAGQDNIVRVWVLKESASNFEEMRLKYSRQPTGRSSPTESMNSSTSATDDDPLVEDLLLARADQDDESNGGPFKTAPFVSYHGHTSDVLDLSWSKNYFLLSSSMDKTVRLWHISRQECLCCFQHVDFVTAICFHPRDDRYFLSGSLDGKIRLWNIPEKKVALWNEIDGSGTSLVTAANFCQNGKLAVVGTYDGRCIFYDTERLKYHTQVTVRSSRGKNARGRKISGIEPMPGEDKVLITSNDSRIRLYDLKDHSLSCKYKGLQNESSQIRAGFSHDGKMILCGSEDKFVYIWRTHHDVANVRNDRNEYYESFSAHDAVVTAAIFAPYPTVIVDKPTTGSEGTDQESTSKDHHKPFEVLVAADWEGGVKLYVNR